MRNMPKKHASRSDMFDPRINYCLPSNYLMAAKSLALVRVDVCWLDICNRGLYLIKGRVKPHIDKDKEVKKIGIIMTPAVRLHQF